MTREEKIEEIRQRTRRNFSLGYNCAECVTEAALSLVETGLGDEVKKLATGFGGGSACTATPAARWRAPSWR